ncbi:MAG TPA: HAD family hydrolase [Myxococcota bacterium]|jgi:putative hydrolase of the HAD superfamily|nr:HAD family hydrolase [Myxococcota bacterium]
MELVEGVVFDMDDTLYLERDYALSGFRAVARFLASPDESAVDVLYRHMAETFESGNRRTVFNQVLLEWPHLQATASVKELVQIYRNHDPAIHLLPGIADLLTELKAQGIPVGLISDGFLPSQESKFRALGIRELVDPAIFTDAWGSEFWKPHPRAFMSTAQTWGIPDSRLAYIGDNPAKDFVAPSALGWRTVRLRIPGQIHEDEEARTETTAAECECTSVRSLTELLRKWTSIM